MGFESIHRAKALLDTLFVKASEPVLANGEACARVLDMLEDADSREAYRRELTYKMLASLMGSDKASQVTGGISVTAFQELMRRVVADKSIPPVFGEGAEWVLPHCLVCTFMLEQYRYKDDVGIRSGDVLLDCGACFGDTAVWALGKGAQHVHAFEIDPRNLDALRRTLLANNVEHAVSVVEAAVGAQKGTLHYNADPTDNAGAGYVTSQPRPDSLVVPVVPIDDFCAENGIRPTFIKMDIEGSEFEALQGAAQTIRRDKPRLAVCLYHKIQDMWTIPSLLRQLVPEYRLYCKKSHPYCEFVLFAAAD